MIQHTILIILMMASSILTAPQSPFWVNPDDDGEFAPVIPSQATRPNPTPADNVPPPAPQIFHSAPVDCSCSFTRQFNPVCGSDGNTYANIAVLNCFRDCGASQVSVRYQGQCRRNG